MKSNYWTIGDSLVVKPGITDPMTDDALDGWQGRLIAFPEQRRLKKKLTIQWDSLTLQNIPLAYIIMCENWGMCWSTMNLTTQDVKRTVARDSEEDVAATIATLETRYSWLSLGEQGKRIQQIVNRAPKHDLFTSFDTWHTYLQEHLVFPFEAIVVEAQREMSKMRSTPRKLQRSKPARSTICLWPSE